MPIETTQANVGEPAARDQPPLLIDIGKLSELLHRSVASLHRDDVAGRLPAGLKLGASKRWRYAEIVEWVQAGMPDRETWMARPSPD
jgi:predicted DNA-binding transcriptional regulator AlpA